MKISSSPKSAARWIPRKLLLASKRSSCWRSRRGSPSASYPNCWRTTQEASWWSKEDLPPWSPKKSWHTRRTLGIRLEAWSWVPAGAQRSQCCGRKVGSRQTWSIHTKTADLLSLIRINSSWVWNFLEHRRCKTLMRPSDSSSGGHWSPVRKGALYLLHFGVKKVKKLTPDPPWIDQQGYVLPTL